MFYWIFLKCIGRLLANILSSSIYIIHPEGFCIFKYCLSYPFHFLGHRAGETRGPLFCVAKRKKENKGKKERHSKQKLIKGCHQGQNVTVLAILERLEFKIFSSRRTIVADNTYQCSMAPPL